VTKGIGDVLNKLQKVKKLGGNEFQACCPAHEDKKPSLTLKQEGDHILLHCQAGCSTEDIVKTLDMSMADLFIEVSPKQEPAKITATYDYLDEDRKLLYQVVRYAPKSFRQRHKNGNGEWIWSMDGVRRVLYHLPEILTTTNETIYLVEGEKDADSLWNVGQVATTSPGGANNWKPEYAEYLKGKRVVIIPDKDVAGYGYARQAAKSLQGKAKEVKAIILPGESKDTTDWLETGGEIETLSSLEQDVSALFNNDKVRYQQEDERIYWDKVIGEQTIRFQAEKLSEERTGIHARITISLDSPLSWSYLNIERREDRSSLAGAAYSALGEFNKEYSKEDMRRDLDAFCAGLWDYRTSIFVPEMLAGDDETRPLPFILHPYLLASGGTILYAPPGRGKSYTALLWAVSVDAGCNLFWTVAQTLVLFINLERSRDSVRRRLSMVNRVLGLPPSRPLLMLNARGKSLSDVMATCRKTVKERGVGLVVLDSISRAGAGDLNENQSGNRVIDALSALCPSWLALGHTPRSSDGHLFGSIMQDAGADICVQLCSQTIDNGTLGIGWELTKQNDTGRRGQEIYALEFGEAGLKNIRKAKPFEFPEVEGKGTQSMEQTIIDFILEQEGADATATQIAEATGFNRVNVSRYLNSSGKFVETRKGTKNSIYYGIKSTRETLFPNGEEER